MTVYFLVKYLHVLGAIVILGTGAGIAFFMLMAHRSRDAQFIARTAAAVDILSPTMPRRASIRSSLTRLALAVMGAPLKGRCYSYIK